MGKINYLSFICLSSILGFTSAYAANPLVLHTNEQGEMTYDEIGIPHIDNTKFYKVECQITKNSNNQAGLRISSSLTHYSNMQYYVNGVNATKSGTEYTYPIGLPNVLPMHNELLITNVGEAPDSSSVFHFSNYPLQRDPMTITISCSAV